MRLGIIDLGTNSVRFDVHQIQPGGKIHLLHREKLMVRLGQGVFLDSRLDSSAIRRTLHAFVSFHKTSHQLQVQRMVAFGTSALREATDANKLIDKIRSQTGIDIRVISGVEEAQLIALGILANEKPPRGRFGLIDIGGGSTEISICEGKKIQHSSSFPIGAYRIQQLFLKSSPPQLSKGRNPIRELRQYLRSILLPKIISEKWPHTPRFIGSSGTIRALERILRKTNGTSGIHRHALRNLVEEMSTMTKDELLEVPGIEPKRVDMILGGAILLEECMDALEASSLAPTGYSLRDGILAREIELISPGVHRRYSFQLEDLFAKAIRLGCHEVHLKQVVRLSEILFDRTKRLHGLGNDWRRYLVAAAILHDSGETVAPIHHEVHSYYIVRNSDFFGMENWESEFIARLCLMHNTGKVTEDDLDFLKEKSKKSAFLKLLAILRVADALDRGHSANLTIHKITVSPSRITLKAKTKRLADIEILRAEQKKDLFEKVFRRALQIEVLDS